MLFRFHRDVSLYPLTRTARNRLAKDKTMNVDQRREEGRRIKDTLGEVEERMRSTEEAMFSEGASLPNLSHPDAPVGPEENAVVVDTIGTKPVFDGWEPLDHVTIGGAR
jgi:seryl-tRNA synthetase